MRVRALLAALVLIAAPAMTASMAYADGIERPRTVRRHRPAPPPLLGAPEQPRVEERHIESNTVTLPESFFVGGGGVGAGVGAGSYSSTTVIIRGGRATAVAFASASASAGAGARGGGHFGGGHGGGCGCH